MLRNKIRISFCIVLIVTCIFGPGGRISGQNRLTLSPGIGFPELLNIGIRYKIFDQAKIGLSIGYWPPSKPGWFSWGNLVSLSGDFYYHFGGLSNFSAIRPWYGRIGLSNILGAGGYSVLCLRLGRDFNLDEKNGISLDAGMGLQFIEDSFFVPVFGACYFFKF
jgi:hypothetical protein